MIENQTEKIKRLIEVMADKSIKQKDMAILLGLGRPNLSAILNQRENRTLPYGTSYVLEVELDVSREWFNNGLGEKYIQKVNRDTYSDNLKDQLISELKDRVDELKKDKERLQDRVDQLEGRSKSRTA